MSLVYLKPILHYALVLLFGKVFEQEREKNDRKTPEKCDWLAFLPYVERNIETFSCFFLAFVNFLRFSCIFLAFSLTFWIPTCWCPKREKNARKKKNVSETTHSVKKPLQ